ncbi:serine-type endopeptidase [Ascochyta rabiei]|uniref:Serine-type endopeptidase n=2 Tax=Didymella rabiei TaxID=5454 RepID=A0A163CNS3_DIDRA|nr:serine-type endopeptidase [Ascochyta rabiei]
MVLLKGLMGVNVAVWGYGMYARAQAKEGHPGNYFKFMQNMTMNLTEFKRGYYWQAVTSMFTHQDFFHIGANLFTFWYLGRGLAAMPVTPGQFMFIVLGSGLSGSLLWLAQQEQKLQAGDHNIRQRGLGFSGALLGATTVLACFQPRNTVHIYGIVPVPLGLVVLGYAFYDGYYLHSENSRVAHAGHLGGLAFGLAYYFLKLRRLRFPGSL